MYFWKTKILAEDIKKDAISDKDWMKYFLFWIILATLGHYGMSMSPYEDMNAMLAEMIGIVGIIILGVSITFKTNMQGSGTAQNYFCRATALSIPIFINILFLSICVGVVMGIMEEALSISTFSNNWVMCIFALAIEAIYFWRINVHLKYINT